MESVVKKSTAAAGTRLPRVLILFALVWIGSIVFGGAILLRHAYSGGGAANPARLWPAGLPVEPAADRPTLVMLIHPGCPCSRASVEQLDRLLARRGEKLRAYLVCHGEAEGLSRSHSFRHAKRIPALETVADPDGSITAAFGGVTSGDTFLYDTDGRLMFHGGITPSRGHAGEGLGYDAILSILDGGEALTEDTPVFGCGLVDEEVDQ